MNRAGVAKLYAKPRFSKQMKISFDVLTACMYDHTESFLVIQSYIKEFRHALSYIAIHSNT